MKDKQDRIAAILQHGPVLPVVVIDDVKTAVPLARALLAGGIGVIEVTLRSAAALDAIRAILGAVDGMVVGAGTVLSPDQFQAVEAAGAAFAVSPGAAPRLMDAADDHALPMLPGAATAGEVMALAERGYQYQKFFPAVPAGGVDYLKALSAPLPEVRFCPTGGIDALNASAFLALANVVCVGGSWLAPAAAVRAADWPRIERLARAALGDQGRDA